MARLRVVLPVVFGVFWSSRVLRMLVSSLVVSSNVGLSCPVVVVGVVCTVCCLSVFLAVGESYFLSKDVKTYWCGGSVPRGLVIGFVLFCR